MAILFGAPAALADTGAIAGTVTDAVTTNPVADVEVDVFDSSQNFVGQVCTGTDGTYSVPNLADGSHTVAFAPTTKFCGTPLNYQPQYYSGQSSPESAPASR